MSRNVENNRPHLDRVFQCLKRPIIPAHGLRHVVIPRVLRTCNPITICMIATPFEPQNAQRRARQSSESQLHPQPEDGIANVAELLDHVAFNYKISSSPVRTLYPCSTFNTKTR